MANTTLNMKLLLRRAEFADSCVLALGEPGYHTGTKEFKIGDGSTTWANLPIANKAQIDALTDAKLAGYKPLQEAIDAVETAANVFVDTVAQDANGKITITTKAVDFSAADTRFKKLQTAIEAVATAKNVFVEQIAQDAQGVITITTKAVDFSDYRTSADQDEIDATFKTKQDAYSAEGSNIKTVTKVTQDANGEIAVTYSDIAFPELSKVEDTEAEVPTADTVVVTKEITVNGHAITEETVEVATAKGVENQVNALANGAVKANTEAIAAINDAETGILKQAKDYTDAGDIFVTDMLTVDKFGGIAGGANLNGKTTHQILTDLLYPYIAFVINSSSRNAAAATLECGESQTLSSATISVTKKKDPITSIKLFNGSTLLEEKTGDAVANGGSITFNGFDAITVTKSNNPNLKFTVTDGTTSTDRNVGASTFVYPYYWGVCADNATIDEALIEGLTKNISGKGTKTDISFTCENQKIVFAYPKAHGVLKSIIDPNNFETIDGYARSEVSITGLDGTAQAYYVYVQKDACTVTGFKVDFKY